MSPSSKKSVKPLQITLKPSKWLALFIFASHFIIAIIVLSTQVAALLKLSLLFGLVLSTWFYWRQHIKRNFAHSIVALNMDSDGEWSCDLCNGQRYDAVLHWNSIAYPQFMILNYKLPQFWFTRSVILSPDVISKELLRQMRVMFRTRGNLSQNS